MCNPADIQHKIHSFTKDGEHIARFLTETMRGKTPGVKICHRMEAAKHLIRYGFPDEARQQDQFDMNESKVENTDKKATSLSTGEGSDGGDNPPQPVTHLDIINYQIAHLIRHETAEGHTLVEFLIHIMTGRDRPFTPKKFRIKARRPHGSSKRTPAPRLRRPRLTPQAVRQHRRSQTPTTPCTQTSPSECASTASAAPTPSASS